MGNFDLVERDHHERWLCELDERVRCWLNQHIGAVGNTGEANLADGDIDIHTLVLSGIGNLLGECLELPIQSCSASSFLLFSLKLLLVSVTMLAPTVASFIELHFSGFPVELYIARLSLADHDRGFEMNVDKHNQLMGTGLKEQMLDVAEEHVDMLIAKRR